MQGDSSRWRRRHRQKQSCTLRNASEESFPSSTSSEPLLEKKGLLSPSLANTHQGSVRCGKRSKSSEDQVHSRMPSAGNTGRYEKDTERGETGCIQVKAVLPKQLWSVFPYDAFNFVQSNCLEAFRGSHNMIISAPTGSGKTVIFEMAICRHLEGISYEAESQKVEVMGKIVYLAPIKALCSEKAEEWKGKFGPLGVTVDQITGDSIMETRDRTLKNVDLICTTPEKWDSLTRSRICNPSKSFGLASTVSLLLVDEIHTVNDERGAVLEAVIARMLLTSSQLRISNNADFPACRLRIIAASATIPNAEDFAEWMKVPEGGLKQFDEGVRPVKLDYKVLGYRQSNPWTFDKYLSCRVFEVIVKFSDQKPVLVFCPTRKSTYTSASALVDKVAAGGRNGGYLVKTLSWAERRELEEGARACSDRSLREALPHGIAMHNGGLSQSDRLLIERLFRRSILRVIFTTTTLAQGVNLPAHLVIIKSTHLYINGKFKEVEKNTLCQMLGRAGRPQFDNTGTAVIMTTMDKVQQYELICRGVHGCVESRLQKQIPEHLLAEICRGTVDDVPSAILWLETTFLRIRMRRNPRLYKIEQHVTGESLKALLKDMVLAILNELAAAELISYDLDGFMISPTKPGLVMAQYYVSFYTMKLFHKEAAHATSPASVLKTIVKATELLDGTYLRRAERKKLNEINQMVRFSLQGKLRSVSEKVSCLIQVVLGGQCDLLADDFGLRAEAQRLAHISVRVAKSLSAYVLCRKDQPFSAVESVLRLSRAIDKRVWWDGGGVVRQIPGIGIVSCRQLQEAGVRSLADLARMHPRKIEAALKKNPPFGNEVLSKLDEIPQLSIEAQLFNAANKPVEDACNLAPGSYLKLKAFASRWDGAPWKRKHIPNEAKNRSVTDWGFILVGCNGRSVLHYRRIRLATTSIVDEKVTLPSSLSTPRKHTEWVQLIFGCESFVGVDAIARVAIPGKECHSRGHDLRNGTTELAGSQSNHESCNQWREGKRTLSFQPEFLQHAVQTLLTRIRPYWLLPSPWMYAVVQNYVKSNKSADNLALVKRKSKPVASTVNVKRLRECNRDVLEGLGASQMKGKSQSQPLSSTESPILGYPAQLPYLISPEALHDADEQRESFKSVPDSRRNASINAECDEIFEHLGSRPDHFPAVDAQGKHNFLSLHKESLTAAETKRSCRTEFDDYDDAFLKLFR